MTTVTFDTHKFVKDLRDAGVPELQAEAFVRAQQEILSQALDTSLATRADINGIKNEIALMDAKFEAKFDKLSWMIGILIAIAIANFAKQFF
ncbi:MAG: DUF1640 domain-containing protein [Burkholderiales bacterium]|nr:DUF1640 domain-containing protein [Burkholderiales bacterium]